jgi:group II intron reverse transcriptase/maturase
MFTHSKGENQKTTKLNRIGKIAAAQKDVVFNNIGHAIDLDLLRECYRQLDRKKAVGIDGVTKEAYGIKLEENLQNLLGQIRRGAYKPRPSRMVEIPKEDGSNRPLAIACLEDKIVQMATANILTLIYEPLFLPCSYGYREGISAHDALRALMVYSNQNSNGATVEIDVRKYFNTIPHEVLLKILREKISDSRFLKLIETLIRSPIIDKGKAVLNEIGCPQGSIISPILSNIYLHYCVDSWFYTIKETHIQGRATLVRFADDMVFVFQNKMDAERFYKVLPKRLEKFGLEMHEGKSSLILSGEKAAEEAHKRGEHLPTYKFLGFVCYWGRSRNNGRWRLKYKSRPDRLRAKLKGLRRYLKESLNQETQSVMKRVNRVVKGWINYHAITDNQKRVRAFMHMCRRSLFWWRNRKGGQRKLNWESFAKLLKATKFPESFKTTLMFAAC